MSEKITTIRGMHDVLPTQSHTWQKLEAILRELMQSYAYNEIRMPIVEKTALFKRSIGDVTDIVQKEMYTFEDRNGDSLSLRPEGTASCVRAGIEHGLLYNQVQKLWYTGPMFRHERPQKGRYRQFIQLGVEAFGIKTPDIDAELIAMTASLWQKLGFESQVELQINTLGTVEDREAYLEALVKYLTLHKDKLDEDSQDRLERNPMRILDSKNPEVQAVLNDAPVLSDYLADDSREHFEQVLSILDSLGIAYRINPRLVRGLDYYSHTVFEWVTESLGAQGTICAGGRFDALVKQLGGAETGAVGFAMGLERILAMLESNEEWQAPANDDIYVLCTAKDSYGELLKLSAQLRADNPSLRINTHCGAGSVKSQMKKADKSGAAIALILGEDELAAGTVSVKHLREKLPQESLKIANLQVYLAKFFKEHK